MKHSEELKDIATALAKAQGQINDAKKDSDNAYFNSKYADLAAVWRACRQALSSNGLSVSQGNEEINGKMYLVSLLMHESGQWIRSEIECPLPSKDAEEYNKQGKLIKKNVLHAIASAMTYTRRIALSAIVGVAPDDDTDDDAESTREAIRHKSIENTLPKINSEDVKRFIDQHNLLDLSNPLTAYVVELAVKTDRKMSDMYEHCYRNKDKFIKTYEQYKEKKAKSLEKTVIEQIEKDEEE